MTKKKEEIHKKYISSCEKLLFFILIHVEKLQNFMYICKYVPDCYWHTASAVTPKNSETYGEAGLS